MNIAILGSTGYVGGRLVPELLQAGHSVRCIVRDPRKLSDAPWLDSVDVVQADASDVHAMAKALTGCDTLFYLIHAMTDSSSFVETDRLTAQATRAAAESSGVARIIYLGGLGEDSGALSPHLASRHEVGEVLAAGRIPVTELRAAVVIGSGSASFEMLRSLTEVLPVMVVPKWASLTRCQPIAIRDVLFYLTAVCTLPETTGKVLDIGGADVLTYREMMLRYARSSGILKRVIIPVPVLTPRLSSHWMNLVTPLPISLARHLVDSLSNDVVVRPQNDIRQLVPHTPMGFDEAVELAIAHIKDNAIPTAWTDAHSPAAPAPHDPKWAGGTVFRDERSFTTSLLAQDLYTVAAQLGGQRGWLVANPLWRFRGFVDKMVGGVGLRRGRRHPTQLATGDVVDFFRVQVAEPPTLLQLRAEMRVPGLALLEWQICDEGDARVFTQRALFRPRGLAGRLYWFSLLPVHRWIFKRLLQRLILTAATSQQQ